MLGSIIKLFIGAQFGIAFGMILHWLGCQWLGIGVNDLQYFSSDTFFGFISLTLLLGIIYVLKQQGNEKFRSYTRPWE
jgi:hypothetical protein